MSNTEATGYRAMMIVRGALRLACLDLAEEHQQAGLHTCPCLDGSDECENCEKDTVDEMQECLVARYIERVEDLLRP